MVRGLKRLGFSVLIVNFSLISTTVSNPDVPFTLDQPITQDRLVARSMYEHLTGVVAPIDSSAITKMTYLISQGLRFQAAKIATEDDNFYNVVVRNMAAKMSTRSLQVDVPLNDFTATFIGNVRDRLNAKDLLLGNSIYMADNTKLPSSAVVPAEMVRDILSSNNHYIALDTFRVNLRQTLKPIPQYVYSRSGSAVLHPEPSGLLTTRSWGAAHFRAGTNRRAVQYVFSQFMCTNLEQMADATGPAHMIAKDVTRTPQGDNAIFNNNCRSCHTMLDFMRPAFAHFDYLDDDNTYVRHLLVLDQNTTMNGGLQNNEIRVYPATGLPYKYYSNQQEAPTGHDLQDTHWYNNATNATNSSMFGWQGAADGDGLQAFASMIANSRGFGRCMVKRAFQEVCNRTPDDNDKVLVEALTDNFAMNNYRIKGLFEQLAARPECIGN